MSQPAGNNDREVANLIGKIMQEQAAEQANIDDVLTYSDRQADHLLDLAGELQVGESDILSALIRRMTARPHQRQLASDIAAACAQQAERTAV